MKRREIKERQLDLSCLDKEPNNFEIRNENNEIISNSCEEYLNMNFSKGLKDGDTASYFFVGLQESIYLKDLKQPVNFNTVGAPSFEVIEYLYKQKRMTIQGIFILCLRLCEDCINELENFIKGEKFKRSGRTSCNFCKEVEK